MILIPSLELMDGKVVALHEGRREQASVLCECPLEAVEALRDFGAVFYHLVDLDAVFGLGDNSEAIAKFVDAQIPVQVGGGVRTAERVEELLENGVERVVLGTLFYEEPKRAKKLVKQFGVRIVAAMDVENGEVRVKGWKESSGLSIDKALDVLKRTGVQQLIYTSIDRNCEPTGPDLDGLREVIGKTEMQVFANVRVRGKKDIESLRALTDEGLAGSIMASAYSAVAV